MESNRSRIFMSSDLIDAMLIAWDKANAPLASIMPPASETHQCAKSRKSSSRRPAALTRALSLPAAIGAGPAMCRNFATILRGCRRLGWQPQRHSTDAVRYAVERILANGF